MDTQTSGVDVERELTCSICAELLYQPLTLLDCLHTFCGACLKEWFTFQTEAAQRSRSSPEPGSVNCPSCRAPVRDTKHNATVVTLLDMIVAAHPEKARSEAEKAEMASKYKPGDQVLPQVRRRRRTSAERRAREEDQRLMDDVREMSLQDAYGASAPPRTRRRRESRSADARVRGDERDSSRQRRVRDRYEESGRSSGDHLEAPRRRRRRSESQHRQVEHQSSLRSLIGSENMSERDIQREIEDFARQIQEEGLLDGLDLDNIDLSRDDELSRRITDAYRRRTRERERERSSRRNTASSRPTDGYSSDSRSHTSDRPPRSGSRQRPHSRSISSNSQVEDRSRPPQSLSATLDVRDSSGRTRRRTGSSGRRSTAPTPTSAAADVRPATRSQTDLPLRQTEMSSQRPSISSEGRSSSTPVVTSATSPPAELPASTPSSNGSNTPVGQSANQSFAERLPPAELSSTPAPGSAHVQPLAISQPTAQAPTQPPPQTSTPPTEQRHQPPASTSTLRAHRPTELALVHSSVSIPMVSPTGRGHQRKRSQLYPEPSIQCSSCGKAHIEYELHYNCGICSGGHWNICLACYRARKGCAYWFGFGYGAWQKWERERERERNENKAPPHMLTASRYQPPYSTPGGADGRKTLTTEDPRARLESGTFCAGCYAWTNQCYWRCDVCNEGDWGFCNDCVNQGKSCTHMLLPLTYEPSAQNARPSSPRSPGRPPSSAAVLTGPQATSIGPFKPLTFTTRCDICQDPIPPTRVRYHCYSCTSGLEAGATPGDYDICTGCYKSVVGQGQISAENGHSGWRRCLNGHRMVVVGFTEGKIGQWRYIDRDMVGGRSMRQEPYHSQQHPNQLQLWSWGTKDQRQERLVTKDVRGTAPKSDEGRAFSEAFPPEGGSGQRAIAKWSWYPQQGSTDELMFPRGAEIREVEDVNGDWFIGTYMGEVALLPAPYVRMMQESS